MKAVINMYDFSENYKALIENIPSEIALLSNTSAFLNMMMEDISWVGFYLWNGKELVLGPFQGKVACTRIAMNKGVCGTSAYKKETLIVPNVHEFEGHIACDSASNSEIVIPLFIDEQLYGVLDIDSTSFDRFHKDDAEILSKCMKIMLKTVKDLK